MRFNQFDTRAVQEPRKHYETQARIATLEIALQQCTAVVDHAARMDLAPDVLQKRAHAARETARAALQD